MPEKKKLEEAKSLIRELGSDMSVPRSECIEALEELQAEIEPMLDAMREEEEAENA